jgi:hypothetical protein
MYALGGFELVERRPGGPGVYQTTTHTYSHHIFSTGPTTQLRTIVGMPMMADDVPIKFFHYGLKRRAPGHVSMWKVSPDEYQQFLNKF